MLVKLISTLIYLFFIKKGILIYALFLGTSDTLIGLSSLIFSGRFQKIFSNRIDLNLFKFLWKRGFNYTKINLLSSGYSLALPIYLKFFMGFEMVGVYGAIEKVYRGFCNISAPFNLILLNENDFKSIGNFFEIKQVRLFFVLFILSLFFVGIFSKNIMMFLISDVNFDTYKFSFLMSLLIPIIVFFSRIFVINFYVKNSLENNLFPIYLSVFLISIPLNIFFIYFFGLIGCIFAAVIIEIYCLYKLNTKLNTIL
jgi:O-antigen/teichoic acid export membrane protein